MPLKFHCCSVRYAARTVDKVLLEVGGGGAPTKYNISQPMDVQGDQKRKIASIDESAHVCVGKYNGKEKFCVQGSSPEEMAQMARGCKALAEGQSKDKRMGGRLDGGQQSCPEVE